MPFKTDEQMYSYWLSSSHALTPNQTARLIEYAGSAEALFCDHDIIKSAKLRIKDASKKKLLDRANALFPSDYAFRDIYLLTSATENEPDTDERAIHGLEGWIACYEKCRLAGTVFAGGVTEPGAIAGHPALETARAMGAAIA